MELYQVYAREKYGLSADWKAYFFEAFPKSARGECTHVNLTGEVCTVMYSKGKKKGTPNWDKADHGTKTTVSIILPDYNEWLPEWESKNGKCSDCMGTGQYCTGWNHLTGNQYQPCKRCQATGKDPALVTSCATGKNLTPATAAT